MALYNGPTRLPRSLNGRDTIIRRLINTANVTASAAGVYAIAFGNDPSLYQQWSTFQGIYREYRVLSMKFHYEPDQQYSNTSTNVFGSPWITAFDTAADTTNPATYVSVATYGGSVLVNSARPWTRTYKMGGIEESGFKVTSSPASTVTLKAYLSGVTNSATIGFYLAEILVQFRGSF